MHMRCLLLVSATAVVMAGCGSTIEFNIYPPGALVTAGGSCLSPCELSLAGKVPPLVHYQIAKDPLYRPTEGTIEARLAPGRVVGAIFTFGIVAAAKGLYYIPATEAHLEPVSNPAWDLESINETGSGRIEGQAFTETRGGVVRHAAGDTITLRVDTPYVRDAVTYLYYGKLPAEGRVTSTPNLQFLDAYKRQTMGDAEGRFGFEGVVPGKYILSAVISWEVPDSEGALAPQLVSVVGFAEVREGTTTKVLVTDWVAQGTGVGRLGEMKIPPIGADAETMGQRLLPDGNEAR